MSVINPYKIVSGEEKVTLRGTRFSLDECDSVLSSSSPTCLDPLSTSFQCSLTVGTPPGPYGGDVTRIGSRLPPCFRLSPFPQRISISPTYNRDWR